MTTDNTTPKEAPVQEHPDAWAYEALGEAVPPLPGQTPTSTPDQGNGKPNASTGNNEPKSTGGGSPDRGTTDQQPPNTLTTPGADGLTGLKLQDILAHPELGRELQSWADKATRSQLEAERNRIRNELEPEIRNRLELEEARNYLEGLSEPDRGQVLASDPKLAMVWGDLQKEKQTNPAVARDVAVAAQVYAMASIIASTDANIQESDLPDTVKTSLMDTSKYESEGPDGISRWIKDVQKALVGHEKDKAVASEIETRWQSYLENNRGNSPRRPNLLPPGQRQDPVPSVYEKNADDAFLAAF